MNRFLLLASFAVTLAVFASCSASADRPAATAERGKKIYEERHCGTCHDATAVVSDAPAPPHPIREPRAVARPHRFAGSRFQRSWIETFLMEPPAAGSGLSGIDALAVARFLGTLRDTSLVPEAQGLEKVAADTAAVAAGATLYRQTACGSCHRMNGVGETIGPDLTGVGGRLLPAYIAANLRDPQRLWPTSEMPNFGFTESQVRSLVAYLSAQQP
jgi:mono/diheme cytochrome c family protein